MPSSLPLKQHKNSSLRECPLQPQKVNGLVSNQGNNDTITIPTNQNSGKYNGNFCGNSFTFMTTSPLPPAVGTAPTAPMTQNDAIAFLQNQIDAINTQLNTLKSK